MKKTLFILGLALLLVLALASTGLAQKKINLDKDTVEVRAIVHPYAEIRGLNDINNPTLHYLGYAGEEHNWRDYFYVVANTSIGMQLNQVDFTSKSTGDTFYTRAKIQRAARYGDDKASKFCGPIPLTRGCQWVCPRARGKWYLLDVKGKLGEVYCKQPASTRLRSPLRCLPGNN